MSESAVVQLSDMSRSLIALEETVAELDEEINNFTLELLRIQDEMSKRITQRDSLVATADQIRSYRKSLYPEF